MYSFKSTQLLEFNQTVWQQMLFNIYCYKVIGSLYQPRHCYIEDWNIVRCTVFFLVLCVIDQQKKLRKRSMGVIYLMISLALLHYCYRLGKSYHMEVMACYKADQQEESGYPPPLPRERMEVKKRLFLEIWVKGEIIRIISEDNFLRGQPAQ